MTAITISTVGFGEIAILDAKTKLFTVFFILISLTVFAYAVKEITQYFLSVNIFEKMKQKKMKKLISSFNDHTLICGFGRNGRQAADRLEKHSQTIVVIESDPQIIAAHQDQFNFLQGDARQDDILIQGNIDKAKHLIVALPNDVDNILVVLSARELNPNLKIVSRLSDPNNLSKLKNAGADHIIMPEKIGGDHMASLLMVPNLIRFLEELSWSGDASPNLEEIAIDDLPSQYLNRSIADLEIHTKTKCNVIGLRDDKNQLTINPAADIKLLPKSILIILGDVKAIKKLKQMFDFD